MSWHLALTVFLQHNANSLLPAFHKWQNLFLKELYRFPHMLAALISPPAFAFSIAQPSRHPFL